MKQALAAAQSAELAASASSRALEQVIQRQQKTLEEGRERERRLAARCDALAQSLSDQASAATRALEAEAAMRAREVANMSELIRALEHAAQARDGELRQARLELRNLAIERGRGAGSY